MIDSIKQKLAKLNPTEPTNLKKAGVLIAILYYGKYKKGYNKYFLHFSSTNWHNMKPVDSIKRLKLLSINKTVIPKIEGVTDQMIIKNLIRSWIWLFLSKFNIEPQYIAPKNVKIIDP